MCNTVLNSAIYSGNLQHSRFGEKPHRFSYKIFMMYLDLDELEAVFSKSIFWSYKKPSLAWMKQSDYFIKSGISTVKAPSLKKSVQQFVSTESGEPFSGRICLLTNIRYFGFIINPISCYYCFDEQEQLKYVVAEVTSTPWNEVHRYLLKMSQTNSVQNIHQIDFSKKLFVSPFMPMEMLYQWRSNTPGEQLWINLKNFQVSDSGEADKSNPVFDASLSLKRKEITTQSLNLILIQFPLMTVKIAVGIYWQALKILLKGIPLIKHSKKQGVPT